MSDMAGYKSRRCVGSLLGGIVSYVLHILLPHNFLLISYKPNLSNSPQAKDRELLSSNVL